MVGREKGGGPGGNEEATERKSRKRRLCWGRVDI